MQLEVQCRGAMLFADMQGEIDMYETEKIRQEVDRHIDADGICHLVFNFSQVSFIDSSGLGCVLGRYRRMQEKGGQTSIVGANPTVEKALLFSGIDRIIPLYPTIEAFSRKTGWQRGREI